MTAACSDCAAPLAPNRERKGTRCRRCAVIARNRDPGFRAARSAAMRIKSPFHDPAIRATGYSPEVNLRRAEAVRAAHARLTADQRSERSSRAMKTRFSWCPDHLRDEYRWLTIVKKIPPAEARRMIEQTIAADASRMISRITAEMHAKKARRARDAY